MLTQKQPQLIAGQGLHWSAQRIFSVVTQIIILLISVLLLTNVIITLGERRLQEDWATQRYSELQSVGTLIADKVSFQQFRTQMFANDELLKRYLTIPSEVRQRKLQESWEVMIRNIPELLDIALFDPQGKYKFSTTNDFSRDPLPPSLLGGARNMGGNEVYTSPLEFTPIKGKLEPYLYQLAWLENPDQSVRGYLLTYQSMTRMLKSIKPAYSSAESPLLMLDTQGLLYAGAESKPTINRIPDTMGGSLRQTYPALWRKMAMSNFGQFHGDDATFVYLKIELTTQYETRREYYLVSYVRNDAIAELFSEWRNILIVGAVVLTLLALALILLSHSYRIGQRSREYSIELAHRLFHQDIGCVIINDKNRVMTANEKAAELLCLPLDELQDRNLQRILQFENEQYAEVAAQLEANNKWQGVIDFDSPGGSHLAITVTSSPRRSRQEKYYLVTFEDVSQLRKAQHQAKLNELLNDNAIPCALVQANGMLELANQAFMQLVSIHDIQGKNLTELLNNDLSSQWPRITQQILLQGNWKGQILCDPNSKENTCLQATLKGHLDAAGEIEHIVCTLEQAQKRALLQDSGDFIPHRSAILVNLRDLDDYFKSLSATSREHSSLLLIDITAESMLSHMSDIGQLENRQREVEIHILRTLPVNYQMSHWQLGKLIVILPDTNSDDAHHFAVKSLNGLNEIGLGTGICMGIASYQTGQNLEQYLSNAEVALKRAKQIGEQNICQAFTRQN
ncbi:PAS domain-containing protein [Shewanella sp. Isolate7]|uniref:PAS domain-containing protein n=1 Tax=Shewanella sp. Isolate7 TaxID=2908528 RepID=UPI001EFC7C7E|nr:PAS domain-containing protein [Shewanella sp. Isolate7]MCG9722907.1 PAS domain-containing protein [Shewanella sp. Isolate7]